MKTSGGTARPQGEPDASEPCKPKPRAGDLQGQLPSMLPAVPAYASSGAVLRCERAGELNVEAGPGLYCVTKLRASSRSLRNCSTCTARHVDRKHATHGSETLFNWHMLYSKVGSLRLHNCISSTPSKHRGT